MHTASLVRNRIRRFLLPVSGFGQMPPDVERTLWFVLGFLTAWVLAVQAGR